MQTPNCVDDGKQPFVFGLRESEQKEIESTLELRLLATSTLTPFTMSH